MAAAAAAGGGGNDGSNGAPVEAGKATPQQMVVFAKKKKRTKQKSKPSEAAGGSGPAVAPTMTPASRGDGAQQQQPNYKKSRLIWTTELHDKFVKACESLGEEDVVPKKILAKMNDPTLTREQIASHLQKYRNKRKAVPTIRRRGNNARVLMVYHGAHPLEEDVPAPQTPPPSLHPPPQQAPFVSLGMSQQQVGHGQLVPNCSGNNVADLLHQHLDLSPIIQPVQHCFAPVQAAAMQRRALMMERQAARMQQAAAASGYSHMILTNHSLGAQTTVTRAPAAPPCGVQGRHRPEPQTQASRAVNMSGERSVPEANARYEQAEILMAQLQIAMKPGGGQAKADGGRQEDPCDILQFWNNDCEPSMDYEFPPNKPT